jgi:hypothetical protein
VINLLANTGFPLLEIGLAGCSQIPEANLIQFFELSGNFLETVDLSFCSQVTDELLFTLGRQKKTPKLQVLKLKGCHQVSDGGILSVTSGCSELTTLDLMRYDLQYKINDIVLLSLAEKCRLLQYITFAGCDMLTDAGLSWMVTGCHAIVDLDLSNCSKVTDVGLRSIGEYLIHLKQLILKNCVRISDLGLRHVAMGCLELTTLDLTNCALISDSSSAGITYPASALASLTLSKNRAPMSSSNTQSLANMGVEPYIVGLAAIAKYSAKLKHLDLTKCSLVSEAALLELAKNCKHLSSLSLYGCHRVTNRSVMKLLSHCHELTVLNLTDCSKISDVAFHQLFQLDEDEKKLLLNDVKQKMRRRSTIRALASFHPGGGYTLVSLRLRNCALISDKTIKRISDACQNLRDLDLSGCHTLTDLALLWLAESEFLATNLRKLWLRDLTNITNTGLSWLVSKQQNVRFFLLDVTGCTGLALSSIQALADFFPFANFRNEKGAHAFRGFFPKHRAEDRFLIEEYGACWRAAIKIQCIYRGRVAYKIARVKRQEALFRWAITKIQSSFRRRQAQKIAIVLKIQRQKEIEAAIRIQRFFRRFLHARQAEIEAEKHYVAYCNVCAIKIQTNWRRKKCRYHFLTYQEMKRAVEAKKLRAIITCQRLWRVKKARNYWHCLQEWTKEFIQCQNKAAKQLQALIRQRAARKEVDHRRKEKLTFKRQQEMAAIKCQKHIRRHQAKKRKQNEENELKKH